MWCHFKALFKYYKFCSKHVLIRPSLGGENGVKGKNIQIMSDILKDGSYYKLYTQPVACQRDFLCSN